MHTHSSGSRYISCLPEKPRLLTKWPVGPTAQLSKVTICPLFSFLISKMRTVEMKTVFVPASPVLREDEVEADDLHASSQHNRQSTHTFRLGALRIARSQPPGNSTHTLTKKKTGGFYLGPKEFPKGGNVIRWTAQMHARRTNAAPISLEARMATSRALAWGLGLWHPEARRRTQTGGNRRPRRGSGGRLQSFFFLFGSRTCTRTQLRWNPFSRVAARSRSRSRASEV